jgi:hypothetical protein
VLYEKRLLLASEVVPLIVILILAASGLCALHGERYSDSIPVFASWWRAPWRCRSPASAAFLIGLDACRPWCGSRLGTILGVAPRSGGFRQWGPRSRGRSLVSAMVGMVAHVGLESDLGSP